MKRIFYFATISAVLLFASCSNEDKADNTHEIQTFTPTISGVIGELPDAKAEAQKTTKTGVIEDNPNYATGEQFYWHDGDKVKVLFFPNGNLSAIPTELTYTAAVAGSTKSNTCQFTTTGSVPAGNYAVYALYPADGWSKDDTGYKATMEWYAMQEDMTSKHLGQAMFMKADAGNVAITGSGDNPINLSFKHLSAVVRFRITDTTLPNPISFNTFTMVMYDYSVRNYLDFFPTEGYLAGGINDNKLTPVEASRESQPTVFVDKDFVDKGTHREFDVFMSVMPTGAPVDILSHRIYFDAVINGGFTQQTFRTVQYGLSFFDQLSFMPNGFEAGKSYYFKLKTDW